ncbi:uroporphyrinogen-III synthase [Candidatus Anaplasma sp. TIGMIC]|uniref:uroporphyrinogen-III synthase n=1 Tax=Candidatus Anaplasma sp. TIGMIC TaxID=3020713 RepID=UPI0023313CB1|nr:uroporphyrinogen-III synthase [Candidatus Anaplasma sp. TIGMIC]MDB1135009.1 uroporphyrinogen-III synthase [Candidatus Anaplasma sp. TIGMIC]
MLLLTRAVEDSIKSKDALAKLGFSVFIEPMFRVYYLSTEIGDISSYDGVIVTSKHGVRGMYNATKERNMRIIAVGDSTMECAVSLGFSNVHTVGGRVDDILQYMGAAMPGANLLYARGVHVSHDLCEAARNVGISVEEVVLYEAVATDKMSSECLEYINNRRISGILFYSERTAEIFIRLAKNAGISEEITRSVSAYTISLGASKALSVYPWKDVLVSQHPTEASLFELLGSFRTCL